MNSLLKRTLSGLVFGLVIVVSTVIWTPLLPFAALFALYYMMDEFLGMSMGQSFLLQRKLAILSAALLFATLYLGFEYGLDRKWTLLAAIPLLAMSVSIIFCSDRSELSVFPYLFTALLYIGLPVGLLPLLLFHNGPADGWLLLSFFIIIWSSDVGAYFLGSSLGQRPGAKKLCPSISPKKSWWGFWSGVFFACLAAAILKFAGVLELSYIHSIAVGLIIGVTGVFGDLFESVWKRHSGVKDSGTIIPGHGGMLDRFDSSLIAIPCVTIYLALFNLL